MNLIVRKGLALIGFALLTWGSLIVGKDGLSHLQIQRSADSNSLAAADEAVRLNRSNPDAYRARAILYQGEGQTVEAINDLRRAVDLRPNDHFLRLELGFARYQANDFEGAITDFRASARLAPFYAQPRWYLGHTLLQTGEAEEGFTEIRKAVASDPSYFPNAIQLANQVYSGDARSIIQALQPDTSTTRLILAQYFIKQNGLPEAMELFRGSEAVMSTADQKTLLADLLAAKRFAEAHEVWLGIHRENRNSESALVRDGGFEVEIDPEALGFEWQVPTSLQRVAVARDSHQASSGAYSLRLDFDGNSPPEATLLSQILLAEPATHYRVSFLYRTEKLVTGGPPVVAIVDAGDRKLLARSSPLTAQQTTWSQQSIEFSTGIGTQAVNVLIRRDQCSSSPCPAFGHIWFDNVVCERLGG